MALHNLNNILFLDIETVPEQPLYDDLDERTRKLFEKKTRFKLKGDETTEDHYKMAAIYAEFGRIVCISMGMLQVRDGQQLLRVNSLSGDDEPPILEQMARVLENNQVKALCAHNGREFDFPYIARRSLINQMQVPAMLDVRGRKPWENEHLIDTMDLWKFGDFKNFTSLDLLTHVLQLPSPKSSMDGSEVAHYYYVENDLESIVKYCERDVVALVQVYQKLLGMPVIELDQVEYV
jgi:3'-5' exonuclease